MSDYGDYDDDGYGSDQDWIYVEDHYDDIDNLVEHVCPSPQHHGPLMEHEYDPYENYWDDLEYLSDNYYDNDNEAKVTAGPKRKRATPAKTSIAHKKSKRSTRSVEPGPVVWMRQTERESQHSIIKARKMDKFALLKDWEVRFRDAKPLRVRSVSHLYSDGENDISDAKGVPGESLDIKNISSVAGLLTGDALGDLKQTLRETLEAQGLDPENLDMVLDDLLAGRDPELSEEDEDEGNEDEETKTTGKKSTNVDPEQDTRLGNQVDVADPERVVYDRRRGSPLTATETVSAEPVTRVTRASKRQRGSETADVEPEAKRTRAMAKNDESGMQKRKAKTGLEDEASQEPRVPSKKKRTGKR